RTCEVAKDGARRLGPSEEDGILAAARAGDESAFTALVERHRGELRVHCYRILGSFEESEDLVQETFLRAWKGVRGFEGRSTVRAWLYRIATNACLDVLDGRDRRVLPHHVAPPSDPTVEQPPRTDVPWLQPFPDRLTGPTVPPERETPPPSYVGAGSAGRRAIAATSVEMPHAYARSRSPPSRNAPASSMHRNPLAHAVTVRAASRACSSPASCRTASSTGALARAST